MAFAGLAGVKPGMVARRGGPGACRITLVALLVPQPGGVLRCSAPAVSPSPPQTDVAGAATLPLTDGWTLASANGSVSVAAVVPGDAHAALHAAGVIGDVYYRFGDLRYSWVANESWSWSRALPPQPPPAHYGSTA